MMRDPQNCCISNGFQQIFSDSGRIFTEFCCQKLALRSGVFVAQKKKPLATAQLATAQLAAQPGARRAARQRARLPARAVRERRGEVLDRCRGREEGEGEGGAGQGRRGEEGGEGQG